MSIMICARIYFFYNLYNYFLLPGYTGYVWISVYTVRVQSNLYLESVIW